MEDIFVVCSMTKSSDGK